MCYSPFLALYRKTLDLSRFFKYLVPENNYNLCFFYTLVTITTGIDCFIKQYNGKEVEEQQQAAALAEAANSNSSSGSSSSSGGGEKQKWQETFAVLHKDVLSI